MKITEVFTPDQIIKVSDLANEIWQEYYPSIIGDEQVKYMLETFQSPKAILEHINEGYVYFILSLQEEEIGYMSVRPRGRSLFVSKLYIKKASRRNGFAREALQFLDTFARQRGLNRLSLTVNIHNTTAIKSYESLGFIKTGTLVQDIGKGFVMDDFTFERQC